LNLELLIAAVLLIGNRLPAQVVAHPNRIQGIVSFSNTNPEVLSRLGQPGFVRLPNTGGVWATRTNVPNSTPSLGRFTNYLSDLSFGYGFPIDSDVPGIRYSVQPQFYLNHDRDIYWFAPVVSDPVTSNGPPVTMNFSECLSVVDVRFVDSGNRPVRIDSLTIYADVRDTIGRQNLQYQAGGVPPGSTNRLLFLRGGVTNYLVQVTRLDVGTNAFSDQVHFENLTNFSLATSCDAIQTVFCILPGVGSYTAAAVRNFAFGEDVLPRDVNVERVERRTGHTFGGAAAQALMDLGATICLARIPRCDPCPLAGTCPSRGTRDEPARKQSRFEGSCRQRRAATLRLVADRPRRMSGLDAEAVRALQRDGLVVVERGIARLPA
jgi:hypothetical protein